MNHCAPAGWQFIGPYMVPGTRRILISEIQARVAAHYHIPLREMVSSRRSREVARPRQVAMFLSRELTPSSFPEIGRRFGDRDHTTVMHACRAIGTLRLLDKALDRDVLALSDRMQNRL
jgi:chromosomal replication initiator protein